MRKRFHILLTVMSFLFAVQAGNFCSLGAAKSQAVDQITLEEDGTSRDADEIQVDLSWKTQQDKGRWIEELGIAADAKSLVLVINTGDSEEEVPAANGASEEEKSGAKKHIAGNSRMFYYTKDAESEWREIFAVNCTVSGGEETSDLYGAYRLERAFGSAADPGSLVPYDCLGVYDYWLLDPEAEGYGSIYRIASGDKAPADSVRLESLRASSNYGMILKPEEEEQTAPALLVTCQQETAPERNFPELQLSQSYLRMLLQSIDPDTRILISGSVGGLEGM